MNIYFDENKIAELYPESEELMLPAGLIWKLPPNKQDMKSEVCSNGEYFAQEKIDGALYQLVRTEHYSYLYGRTKSKVTGLLTEKCSSVPHIAEALSAIPAGTILIGEIFVPGGTSKSVTHIMGCLPEEAIRRQQKEGNIHYYVHDMIYYNGEDISQLGALERYNKLAVMWDELELNQYPFLHLATIVEEGIEEKLSEILSNGGEGMVLKKKDAPYTPGKRPAWHNIKFKQMDSIDLVCVGLCDATKEYTGKELNTWEFWEAVDGEKYQGRYLDDDGNVMIKTPMVPITKPYFYGWKTAIEIAGYDEEGKLVKLGTVSSGLTDADKESMSLEPETWLNTVVSLDCMSIDKKEKTLRHPVFKCQHVDKNPEDCKIAEIFN